MQMGSPVGNGFVARYGEVLFAEPCVAGAALCRLPTEWLGAVHFYAACIQLHRAARAMHATFDRAKDFLSMDVRRMSAQVEAFSQPPERVDPDDRVRGADARAQGKRHSVDASDADDVVGHLPMVMRGVWFNHGMSFLRSDRVDHMMNGPSGTTPFAYSAQLSCAHRLLSCAALGVESMNLGVAITAAVDLLSVLCLPDVTYGRKARKASVAGTASGDGVAPRACTLESIATSQMRNWYMYPYSELVESFGEKSGAGGAGGTGGAGGVGAGVAGASDTQQERNAAGGEYVVCIDQVCDLMESTEGAQDKVRSSCIELMEHYASRGAGLGCDGDTADTAQTEGLETRMQRAVLNTNQKYSHAVTCDMQQPVLLAPAIPMCVANVENIRDARVQTVDARSRGVRNVSVSHKICTARTIEEDTASNMQWALTLAARSAAAMLHALPVMWCARDDFNEHTWNAEQMIFVAEEWRRAMMCVGQGYEDADDLANRDSSAGTAPDDAVPFDLASSIASSERELSDVMGHVYFVPHLKSVFTQQYGFHAHTMMSASLVGIRDADVSWDAVASAKDLVDATHTWMKTAIVAAQATKHTCERVASSGCDALVKHQVADRYMETGFADADALDALRTRKYSLDHLCEHRRDGGRECGASGAASPSGDASLRMLYREGKASTPVLAASQTCALPTALIMAYYDTHSGLESTHDAASRACRAVSASVLRTAPLNPDSRAHCSLAVTSALMAHNGVSRYASGNSSAFSSGVLCYAVQTTREMMSSEHAVDIQMSSECSTGRHHADARNVGTAAIGRCGVVKCAHIALPVFLGPLVASNRLLKTSQRFNHVFSTAMISHAVDTAVSQTTGDGSPDQRKRNPAFCIHEPGPGSEAVHIIANSQLVRTMPAMDDFTMDYLKAHVLCAMIRCCIRGNVMPTRVAYRFGWFVNFADSLSRANHSRAPVNTVVRQLRFLSKNGEDTAGDAQSEGVPGEDQRTGGRSAKKGKRKEKTKGRASAGGEAGGSRGVPRLREGNMHEYLDFCKSVSAAHDEVDYDVHATDITTSALVSRLYHVHYLLLRKINM